MYVCYTGLGAQKKRVQEPYVYSNKLLGSVKHKLNFDLSSLSSEISFRVHDDTGKFPVRTPKWLSS